MSASFHQPPATLVTVTPYGRTGGSSRVRVFDWLDHLGLAAESNDYLGGSSNSRQSLLSHPAKTLRAEAHLRLLSSRIGDSNLVLSRNASPFSTGILESRLLHRAALGIYDFDDALFADARQGIHAVFSKASIWSRAVAAADRVIAGNEFLAEHAQMHNRDVVIVPSCVETKAYSQKDEFAIRETPRLVWIGSPATEQFLTDIADPLLRLHRERGARLTVISAGSASLGRLDAMIDREAWDPATSNSRLSAFDIGIAPLRDSTFTRGKCAYKLLQYAASGLPFAATPIGANRTVLDRTGGISVEDIDAWYSALTEVMTLSESQRALLGSRSRAAVDAHYSFDAWGPVWRSVVLGS